jgi:hypothetical protein
LRHAVQVRFDADISAICSRTGIAAFSTPPRVDGTHNLAGRKGRCFDHEGSLARRASTASRCMRLGMRVAHRRRPRCRPRHRQRPTSREACSIATTSRARQARALSTRSWCAWTCRYRRTRTRTRTYGRRSRRACPLLTLTRAHISRVPIARATVDEYKRVQVKYKGWHSANMPRLGLLRYGKGVLSLSSRGL